MDTSLTDQYDVVLTGQVEIDELNAALEAADVWADLVVTGRRYEFTYVAEVELPQLYLIADYFNLRVAQVQAALGASNWQ